jgi:hypothetical protein
MYIGIGMYIAFCGLKNRKLWRVCKKKKSIRLSGPSFQINLRPIADVGREQGCQMVCFQTKNPNLGKFWRALGWKIFMYFMAIWNILWRFGIFNDHLVHFFPVLVSCTKKNLATLAGRKCAAGTLPLFELVIVLDNPLFAFDFYHQI